MRMLIFAAYDRKAALFMQPFFARSQAEAMRMVASTIAQGGNMLADYTEDYDLTEIGFFDDDDGHIEGIETTFVVACVNLKRQPDGNFTSVPEQPVLERPNGGDPEVNVQSQPRVQDDT